MSAFTRSALSLLLAIAAVATVPPVAFAQSESPPLKPKPNPYASPLDTLMSTHLWTDVPPMKDFVTATHPDPQKLEYAPLVGQDPERPKLRDAAGVAALQAELESGVVANDARAKGLHPPRAPRKTAAKTSGKPGGKTRQTAAKAPAPAAQ